MHQATKLCGLLHFLLPGFSPTSAVGPLCHFWFAEFINHAFYKHGSQYELNQFFHGIFFSEV